MTALRVCNWKHDKRWVYSITYDEALADLHRFAIPHHDDLGIPGHVEVVCSQIGQIRNIGTSTFNGYRHMNADELVEMLARGWGVGVHGWSHHFIHRDMVDQELRVSREVLEEAIGQPVPLYIAPNGNENMSGPVIEGLKALGYLGGMSITDGVNPPEMDPYFMLRTPLHDYMCEPFYSDYDPYRNIRAAQEMGGWMVDYLHCPVEVAIHPNKDCTEAQLRRRLETILAEGGDDVWCANADEAASYFWCRRTLMTEVLVGGEGLGAGERRYRIYFNGELPERACSREVTIEVEVPTAWCNYPQFLVDGVPQIPTVARPGVLRATVDVGDGIELRVGAG